MRPFQTIRKRGSEGLIIPVSLAVDYWKNFRRGRQVIKVPICTCIACVAPSLGRLLKATKVMAGQRLPLPDVISLFFVKQTKTPVCQMFFN